MCYHSFCNCSALRIKKSSHSVKCLRILLCLKMFNLNDIFFAEKHDIYQDYHHHPSLSSGNNGGAFDQSVGDQPYSLHSRFPAPPPLPATTESPSSGGDHHNHHQNPFAAAAAVAAVAAGSPNNGFEGPHPHALGGSSMAGTGMEPTDHHG